MAENELIKSMADKCSLSVEDFKKTVKATCGLGKASDEDFLAFLMVAQKYDLNPITREIYAFPKTGGGIQVIMGVDGWFALANRNPNFGGIEFEDIRDKGAVIAIKAKVYHKLRQQPVEVIEYMSECRRNTDPWNKSPIRMLRHKAAIQALRYGLSLSGIVDPDEAERVEEAMRRQANRGRPVATVVIEEKPAAGADDKDVLTSVDVEGSTADQPASDPYAPAEHVLVMVPDEPAYTADEWKELQEYYGKKKVNAALAQIGCAKGSDILVADKEMFQQLLEGPST